MNSVTCDRDRSRAVHALGAVKKIVSLRLIVTPCMNHSYVTI